MARRGLVGATVAGCVLVAAVMTVPVASQGRAEQTRTAGSPAGAAGAGQAVDFRPVLNQYCVTCHNQRASTGATASGVVLDRMDIGDVSADRDAWEKVVRRLKTASMPPAGMPRPDEATQQALVSVLETRLDAAAVAHPHPGRPAVHRLNRSEYANAIRDLLALDVDTSVLLPPDDSADGFDNNADALGVSPALLERYLAASAKISALAVGSPLAPAGSAVYRVRGDGSQTDHEEGAPLGTRGGVVASHVFSLDGEYLIKVKLLETNLGSIRGLEYVNQLEIAVDGERVLLTPVGGPDDYTKSSVNATDVVNSLDARLQARVRVKAGTRTVTAAFLEKTSALGGARLQPFLRTTLIATDHLGLPHVESMTIVGPFNPSGPGDTPSRQRVFTCRPAKASDERACAGRIVRSLATRAFRRPVTEPEAASLMAFYDAGRRQGTFESGVELALRGVLVSPRFIFRIERDPAGVAPGAPYRLSDLELASRLSFFLWSSIPDDELRNLAAAGRLRAPGAFERQVRRMLADPKAEALVNNFAAQWLQTRNLRSSSPDNNDFPNFDDNLRRAFGEEMDLFVGSIVRDDRSVLDLMTADYTFVNERLARHYGIPNVYGSRFRRVTLPQDERRGLLGKGGVLLVTSHADRTSPVVRGKWILDNLLGTPPPPPPPNVPSLPDEPGDAGLTMRQRMERHRASPACASCHRVMDPLGLALENFDAVGAWRMKEGGSAIDATGQLSDGTKVSGVATLRSALMKRPEVFVGTVSEKLLTYALGRGLEGYDMPAVRGIVRAGAPGGYRFSDLVLAVVASEPFQMRTAADAAESPRNTAGGLNRAAGAVTLRQ